jgi:hypothetical protein
MTGNNNQRNNNRNNNNNRLVPSIKIVNNISSSQSNPNDTSNNGNWTVQPNKRNLSNSSVPNLPKSSSQPTKKKFFAIANRFEVFS